MFHAHAQLTKHRDSSGSLDLQQVLGLVPAARLASAAARVILQEATLQSLAEEAADPQACADSQQGCAVLREVLTCAFLEADPHSTGVIKPGEQLMQLLFVCAAQLTTVMIGGGGSMSRENTAGGIWGGHGLADVQPGEALLGIWWLVCIVRVIEGGDKCSALQADGRALSSCTGGTLVLSHLQALPAVFLQTEAPQGFTCDQAHARVSV